VRRVNISQHAEANLDECLERIGGVYRKTPWNRKAVVEHALRMLLASLRRTSGISVTPMDASDNPDVSYKKRRELHRRWAYSEGALSQAELLDFLERDYVTFLEWKKRGFFDGIYMPTKEHGYKYYTLDVVWNVMDVLFSNGIYSRKDAMRMQMKFDELARIRESRQRLGFLRKKD
jgi:hypothetical protein